MVDEGETKFFITAPFITVGWRWQAWRIQPIIPVTVDLPLVPPTATLLCAALSNCANSCGRVTRSSPSSTARTTSGMVGSTAADVTRVMPSASPLPSCAWSGIPSERR